MAMLLPRRSVRMRLTALYCALFLVSAVAALAITNGVGSTSRAFTAPGGARPATGGRRLQDAVAAQAHSAASGRFLLGSVIALGVMAVASVAAAWLIVGRVLRPLQAMAAATRRISADSLHERLAMAERRDELTELGDTIDGLLKRLEGAFEAQRRFVANASHELRTPLTTMRASLDVAVAKPDPAPPQTVALAGRLRAELDRTDQLLDGLLTLARAEHGVLPGSAVVSLSALASASLAARSDAIAARRLTVRSTDGPGGALVAGSQPLLARMVDNVIENAIGHNSDGGWVAADADAATGRLVVESGGEVLDPGQVARLGQPFRRLGAGLGLSIVAAVAAAHGGSLDLQARTGGGLRVAIALPLAAPAPAPAPAPAAGAGTGTAGAGTAPGAASGQRAGR